jgi:hypothetical protein
MDDHERGCQGRCYTCTCGYDDRTVDLITTLAKYVADHGANRPAKFNECCRALEAHYGLNYTGMCACGASQTVTCCRGLT